MAILAQQYPVYQPAMRIISTISNSNPAVVTTTFAHQYRSGLIVRLIIPTGFGQAELNEFHGAIEVLSSTTFSIDINTQFIAPWSAPDEYPANAQYAQVVPIGEVNSSVYGATQNVLPYSAT